MVEIGVSLLNMKNENAIQTLYNLETAGIEYFHIDVMDGKFVTNNTVDQMLEYCEYLSSITNLPLDVHLMVEDVKTYIDSFLVFEPNIITFHLEAAQNKEEVLEWIKYIKENNVRVGISIKPTTKLEEIYEYLPLIHEVLIMTVEPGKGGQALIRETVSKIEILSNYVKEKKLEVDIEADGGIKVENASLLKKAGANIIVAGTAILDSENFKETVEKLKK
ncbi:MAG: ribulose-phosphate 3-epimerase [Clostridia bacterium]|jgi:ribulose-phosphate 3-epimerase|nr:ribulose-phosphate 3-epimerase [Clostridia bacterium]